MFIIIHVNEKGEKLRERHEHSATSMLSFLLDCIEVTVKTGHGFTYAAQPLPSIAVDNGHKFYVERHTQH